MKSIKEAGVAGKRVLLRVDFNVPMHGGVISDINRIKAVVPTIRYLLDSGAKVIIATHLGKPDGRDLAFSTIPLAKELSKLIPEKVTATDEVSGPNVESMTDNLGQKEILFIGNLRFNYGEQSNDASFASSLAKLAEIYCNDGFAVCHREAASISAITKYLPSYAGLLLQLEIENLSKLMQNPACPFVVILGGAKIKDKARAISNLGSTVDKILVGGAVGNTFLAAGGQNISKSLFDTEMIDDCKAMLEKYGDKIIIPFDAVKEPLLAGEFSIKDIGPETIKKFKEEIGKAKTIFWNGNLGFTENDKFTIGTEEIAKALVNNKGVKIIAGGDTGGFIYSHSMAKDMTFISTGGGAALEFLAGKKLPGLTALG